MKIILDNIKSRVEFSDSSISYRDAVHQTMHREMGIRVDGAHYSKAYKIGVWDGIEDFYNMKEDTFHTGLLPKFLTGIRKLQDKNSDIKYEIVDNRPERLLDPESIDEVIELGDGGNDPITLRDYQHEAVKQVFKEQVGIINVATNGK